MVSCLAVSEEDIDDFLDSCILSKHHKDKPGKEADVFNRTFHCSPWKDHACCTSDTSSSIGKDGAISLYRMHWDQCNRTMSPACRRFFEMDTCMYECSPNMKPWITRDPNSKRTRKERFEHVPICAKDCDDWFDACKDDYTCSDNWGDIHTWNWTKNGNECKMECKTFKEYYQGPKNFCDKIFNYSWKYTEGTLGEDCMTLWPNGTTNINTKVARKHTEALLTTKASGSRFIGSVLGVVVVALLVYSFSSR